MTNEHKTKPTHPTKPVPTEFVGMLENARVYFGSHIVDATDGRKCVDGRYTREFAGIATPGGDFGFVITLMALKPELSAEQAFDAVYNAVTQDGGSFYMHTAVDLHGAPIGCGHIAKAMIADNEPSYGNIDHQKVADALVYAQKRMNEGANIVMVPLPGSHREKGVGQVHGSKYTVAACDSADSEQMYFIYDVERNRDYIKNLSDKLGVSFDEFYRLHNQQLQAILKLLAIGYPIYDIFISDDGKRAKVEFAGKVE